MPNKMRGIKNARIQAYQLQKLWIEYLKNHKQDKRNNVKMKCIFDLLF